MKILLDTHYLLWSFLNIEKIPLTVQEEILKEENSIYYSQASLWEISIKYNLGKIVFNNLTPEQFFSEIKDSFLLCKKLENDELISFYKLPIIHRDPFDRLMIWQCILGDYLFASADHEIGKYCKYGLKILS